MTDTRFISKEHYQKQRVIADNTLVIVDQLVRALDDSYASIYHLNVRNQVDLVLEAKAALNRAWGALARAKVSLGKLERMGR